MRKIKILVVPSDTVGGVGFYRSFQPHNYLKKYYGNDFEVLYERTPDWKNLELLKQFDIINVHKGLFTDMRSFYDAILALRETNTVTIMDIDDSWDLSPTHPQYLLQTKYGLDKIITTNLKLFDYITTTTEYFAKKIYKYNKHVIVLPNAIDGDDKKFKINKNKSKLIRVGMVMGSAHEYDVKLIDRFVKKLSPETLDKIQIVLCGFDTRGNVRTIDVNTGKIIERPIMPTETVWHKYEEMLTDNYNILSREYKMFLNMYNSTIEYPNVENEHYRRCWTKPVDKYFSHYENIDILLAPLEMKEFNYVKSELKAIECAFSNTALIASDYGPYHLVLENALNNDYTINPNGNAILIDESKNDTDWAKSIELLVNDNNLRKKLQYNISNLKTVYNLKNITKKRAAFYQNICQYQDNND